MSEKSRMEALSAAFRDTPLTCGALTLRPLTAGSVMLLMETGNPLFAESETPASDAAHMQGVFEYIYIHTAAEDDVLEACADRPLLAKRARALALHTDLAELGAFSAQFAKVKDVLASAIVHTIEEPGAGGKPVPAMPNPTGSPPSSTPSAAAETPPASAGYSGDSPSPAPSNTSTPPSVLTESASAGRTRIWEEDRPPQPTPENLIPLP